MNSDVSATPSYDVAQPEFFVRLSTTPWIGVKLISRCKFGGQLLIGRQYIGSMNSANIVLNFVLENNIVCKMPSFLAIDKQIVAI
jgi:hypothetical protein